MNPSFVIFVIAVYFVFVPLAAAGCASKYGPIENGHLQILKTVLHIDASAFDGCKSLTSVSFEPGSALLTIGEGAFRESGLTGTVTIPRFTIIGERAFREARVKEGIDIAVIQLKWRPFSFYL